MRIPFVDPFPGRPRVLFLGLPHSSHTHSWIHLLDGGEFNSRLFGVHLKPDDWPYMLRAIPDNWDIPTFIPLPIAHSMNPAVYFPASRRAWIPWRVENRITRKNTPHDEHLLAHVLKTWRPHIVHTLGMEPAGFFYQQVITKYDVPRPQWVAQIRGGPELTLKYGLPDQSKKIQQLLQTCDYVIADNDRNYEIIRNFGIDSAKLPLGRIPGTGGIDVGLLSNMNDKPPSQRERIIVVPKGYDGLQSKAMPILEALRRVWESIAPCTIYFLAVSEDVALWINQLPDEIRQSCKIMDRVKRDDALELIAKSRVMLAPSLLDGVPNVLYESMAAGAMPIVSPVETFAPLVTDHEHVIFAHNLYPEEIAQALVLAMTDDALVDRIAVTNAEYVRQLADRDIIRHQVMDFYNRLSTQ